MTVQSIPMGQAKVIKELIPIESGYKAEAIYFNRPEKQVICLSCQLSCPVGCSFCASPDGNPTINISKEDMIKQIEVLSKNSIADKTMLISFMGEGEPALNIDRIMEVITHYDRLSIEGKLKWPIRFSISTSGVKPKSINKLAKYSKKIPSDIKLQFSLHSPTDEGRAKIIPVSKPLSEIIPSVVNYMNTQERNKVDINYTLIKGQNDSSYDCLELVKLVDGHGLHVKLSKYNQVKSSSFETSDNHDMFLEVLKEYGISCEYHFTDGEDIDAACGQTRSNRQVKERL